MAEPKDRGLDRRVSDEARALARSLGLTITVSEGRGSALMRAQESVELALAGDESLLDKRLSAGHATPAEQKLIADLRAGRVRPRKKRLDELLAADRRQLVAEFVKARTNAGVKQDAAVKEAEQHFKVAESEVWKSLSKPRK